MDFSDMFRRADGEGGKPVASKPRLTSTRRAHEQEQSQENVPPTTVQNTAESDSMAYVKNALRNMNHDLQTKDLTPAALQAIEMLYSEVCFEFSLYLLTGKNLANCPFHIFHNSAAIGRTTQLRCLTSAPRSRLLLHKCNAKSCVTRIQSILSRRFGT